MLNIAVKGHTFSSFSREPNITSITSQNGQDTRLQFTVEPRRRTCSESQTVRQECDDTQVNT